MTGMDAGRRAIIAGHRLRQAHEKLIAAIADGTAKRGDVEIMMAAAYWNLGWGKYSDNLYLGQIAWATGRWTGDPADCPDHIRKYLGRRLKALTGLGVLEYSAGRGRGVTSKLTLPTAKKRGDGGDPFSSAEKGSRGVVKGVTGSSKRGDGGSTLPRDNPRDNPEWGPGASGAARESSLPAPTQTNGDHPHANEDEDDLWERTDEAIRDFMFDLAYDLYGRAEDEATIEADAWLTDTYERTFTDSRIRHFVCSEQIPVNGHHVTAYRLGPNVNDPTNLEWIGRHIRKALKTATAERARRTTPQPAEDHQ